MSFKFFVEWMKNSARIAVWLTTLVFIVGVIISVAAVLYLDDQIVLAVCLVLLLIFCGIGWMQTKETQRFKGPGVK